MQELPILHKLCELYKIFYGYLKLFAKPDRHALGAKCEMYIISALELLLQAGYSGKEQKLLLLKQASVKLDCLKYFIRLACDLEIIDRKKYLILQNQMQDIGRQLGGWQRSEKENSRT